MSKELRPRGYPAELQPMLAPNKCLGLDIPFNTISWPKLCSTKYNGVRGLSMDGRWCSRNMRESDMCQTVAYEFKPILDWAYENRIVLDGEFHSNTYNTVGETRSIMAGTIPLPDDFMFKCFYALPYSVWNSVARVTMGDNVPEGDIPPHPRFYPVKQKVIHSLGEFVNLVDSTKHLNLEGYILLDPNALYKHGRGTIKQQLLLKYKYYGDKEDAKIVGIVPRQERRAGSSGGFHATGLAKPVYKQGDKIDTDIAGTMECYLEGDPNRLIHVPFPVGWDTAKRRKAYKHFQTESEYDIYGQWVCFQRLACENRDKPIAIKGVEFRDSKD